MNVEPSDELTRTLRMLKKKDPALFRQVQKKINQISLCDETSIQHFKNLRGDRSDYKRVHIGSFVLTFQIKEDTIIFKRFTHHDKAYKR